MRPGDWQKRFVRYLAGVAETPFVWGENDCATFVANWFLALTGVDPLVEFRGRYHCERTAAALICGRPYTDLIDAAMAATSVTPIRWSHAAAGDAVAYSGSLGAIGLIDLNGRLVAPCRRGLKPVPVHARRLAAWRAL